MKELPRLQEMALEGQELIMIVPCQQGNRITIADTLTDYQSNSQLNVEKRRDDYFLDSVPSSDKQVAGFSQNTQSTGNRADIEQDAPLPTTTIKHKTSPLTARSIPLNKSSVTVQYSSTEPTFHQLIDEVCSTHSELDPMSKNQSLYFNCLVCTQASQVTLSEIELHLADVHPEVFFADIKSPNVKESMAEETSFRDCCKFILQFETYQTNPLKKKVAQKKRSRKHTCCQCGFEHTKLHHLKLHMFEEHYNVLKENLVAYCRKLGHKHLVPDFSFGSNKANNKTVKEIASSNPVVNMELQEPSQNLEYKCRGESGGKEFVQKHKCNTTSNSVEQRNSTGFGVVAEPVAGTSFGDNFLNNENANAVYLTTTTLNFHEASLENQSHMNSNRVIPNVCLNPASFATFSNYLPLPPTTTTTSNYGNTFFTNNIQQPVSTFVEPGNLLHFIPTAPLVASEQQQMERNQAEISALQPFHAYSFPSSCSASTINQVVPYQLSNNSTATGSNDDNIVLIATSYDLESTLLLETFPPSFDAD